MLALCGAKRIHPQVIDQIACTDAAAQGEDQVAHSRENRFVQLRPGELGVDEITGAMASGPARRLWARMDEIAGWLGEVDAADGNVRRPVDVRRSVALTMFADHDRIDALYDRIRALRHRCATDPEPESEAAESEADAEPESADVGGNDDTTASEAPDP